MVKLKKVIAISSYIMLFSISSAFAHEFPSQKGECFLVKNNIPQKNYNCTINSGGGAGGSYTTFKINKANVLIEENETSDRLLIGNDFESLEDGTFYYRNLKDRKIITIQKARNTPAYYCAKQSKGHLDACYITD